LEGVRLHLSKPSTIGVAQVHIMAHPYLDFTTFTIFTMVRRYLIRQLAVITCDDAEHDVVKLVDFQFL
jgi:hypothetical protein